MHRINGHNLWYHQIFFYFFAGIYATGLIGLPWDALALWATKKLPDNSLTLQQSWFQIAVFGSLVINVVLMLVGEGLIQLFALKYQLESYSNLSSGQDIIQLI